MKYVDETLSEQEEDLIQNFIVKEDTNIELPEFQAIVHMMYITYKRDSRQKNTK